MPGNKSRILAEVHEAARDLHEIGVMDAETMRKFDALCLPHMPHSTARPNVDESINLPELARNS